MSDHLARDADWIGAPVDTSAPLPQDWHSANCPERPPLRGKLTLPERLRHLIGRPGLYSLGVTGTCMAPLYVEGDFIVCDPHAPLEPGIVVCLWRDDRTAWLKRLVAFDAKTVAITAESWNVVRFARRGRFPHIHAVVGRVTAVEAALAEGAA